MGYENEDLITSDEFMQEMVKALQDAIEVQEKYSETLTKLEEENQFLTDTIIQNKLGNIVSERRDLLTKLSENEFTTSRLSATATETKKKYETRLDKVAEMIEEMQVKQLNLDRYIAVEAEKKIAKQRKNNEETLKKEQKKLYEKYLKCERGIKRKLKIHYVITIVSVCAGIAGVLLKVLL